MTFKAAIRWPWVFWEYSRLVPSLEGISLRASLLVMLVTTFYRSFDRRFRGTAGKGHGRHIREDKDGTQPDGELGSGVVANVAFKFQNFEFRDRV